MADDIEPRVEPPAPVTSARHAVPRIIEAIRTESWAITESMMETIVAIANRENEISIEALEAMAAKRVANAFDLRVREGVGLITVAGPLVKYADIFSMISGATSYEAIRRDLQVAMQDPAIRSVLITFDSPGGLTNGCAECADAIRAAGAIKPVEAYVSGSASSAAYWLATACNKITMDKTAHVGSIGVIMSVRDTSERDAKSGIKITEFVSSRAPNKRLDIQSDEGKAKVMRLVDTLEDIFIGAVAENRGRSIDDVSVNFGRGGIEVGADAVRIGMADALGSFEQVFARLKQGNGQTARITREGPSMSQFTQEQMDAAVAQARSEATATATAEATTAATTAATAAQTRIAAILDAPEAATRATQAKHLAFKTSMSAEEAIDLMKASAEEKAPAAAAGGTGAAPRAQDAAGGLALDTLQPRGDAGTGPEPKKPAPVINSNDIYAKRAAQHTTA